MMTRSVLGGEHFVIDCVGDVFVPAVCTEGVAFVCTLGSEVLPVCTEDWEVLPPVCMEGDIDVAFDEELWSWENGSADSGGGLW